MWSINTGNMGSDNNIGFGGGGPLPYDQQVYGGMSNPYGANNTAGQGGSMANYGPVAGYGGSGIMGAYGAGSPYAAGGAPTLSGLLSQQRQSNQDTRNYNRGLWGDVSSYTRGVPTGYDNDPMNRGARSLAQGLLDNPEALNDRTQQLAVNRASNLLNAGQNAQRQGTMNQLASRGMLGGSAQNAAMNGIERQRQAQLVGLGSDLEVRRAMMRNQDIMNASNLGSSLAGQSAGVHGDAAKTLMSGVPYEGYDDLSGYASLLGGQGNGSFSAGLANGGRSRQNSPNPNLGFQGNWTAPQQSGPFVNQFGAYQDNYNPQYSGYGQGGQYADQYGNMGAGGAGYGSQAPGGTYGTQYQDPLSSYMAPQPWQSPQPQSNMQGTQGYNPRAY